MKKQEEIHELLLKAIRQKRLIHFKYKQKIRVAEPHDYGIQRGRTRLLCYQLRGESSEALPNWRLIDVPGASDLQLLTETFAGSRGNQSSKHNDWDELFARVSS